MRAKARRYWASKTVSRASAIAIWLTPRVKQRGQLYDGFSATSTTSGAILIR